jgi:hypothetical protein
MDGLSATADIHPGFTENRKLSSVHNPRPSDALISFMSAFWKPIR